MGDVFTLDNWNNLANRINVLVNNPPEEGWGMFCKPYPGGPLLTSNTSFVWSKGLVDASQQRLRWSNPTLEFNAPRSIEQTNDRGESYTKYYWDSGYLTEIEAALAQGWTKTCLPTFARCMPRDPSGRTSVGALTLGYLYGTYSDEEVITELDEFYTNEGYPSGDSPNTQESIGEMKWKHFKLYYKTDVALGIRAPATWARFTGGGIGVNYKVTGLDGNFCHFSNYYTWGSDPRVQVGAGTVPEIERGVYPSSGGITGSGSAAGWWNYWRTGYCDSPDSWQWYHHESYRWQRYSYTSTSISGNFLCSSDEYTGIVPR